MAEFPSFEEWLRQRGISRYAPGPAPGYQPRAVVEYGGVAQAPVDNYVWRVQAADVIANNVLYNPDAAGRPGGWDDAKYGSWDELVKRNQGRDKFYDGDYQKIFNYITDKYGNAPPPPGSYLERAVGGWVAPTGQEFVLSREEEMRLLGEYRYDRELSLDEDQFEWQKQTWMMNYELEKQRMAQDAAYRQQSLALEGQRLGLEAQRLDLQAKQMEQQYQLALKELAQQRELKMLELSQEKELTLARLDMEWRIATLQANTQLTIAEKQLAFEREKWEAQKALERAKVITQLTANPSDVIAREYFIRTGYEPIGNIVNVFTGLPEGMGTLTGAQTLNAYQIPGGAYVGTPGTLVLPPPPAGEPTGATGPATTPPAPPPPSMAHGGYTDAPVFVVGDSVDGKETGYEEIVINPTRAPVAVVPLSKLVGRK